jgi:cyclohexanone monooxygenase
VTKPTVAILGAGVGGIAMGIKLKRAGYEFTIFEKSDGVGGTWRDNTYPGAACDVPSHFYSFSFALNPEWSRTYATQPEILAYLERCCDHYGIRPHIRTDTAIERAQWNEVDRLWELTATSGEEYSSEVLISGLGMLNAPNIPHIPGSEVFQGRSFHSSRWDHTKSVRGERVASIGTGASAIQYVPAIAPEAARVSVFQRTPIWITPRLDRPYTDREQRTFARFPLSVRLHRFRIWRDYQRGNFQADSEQTVLMTELARSYLARKIEDPELRAALTPDYPVGCKRPLMSRDWLPALLRPNVHLVTQPIEAITEQGVRTADGELHEVDTIIYGTGFKANEYLSTIDIIGEGARRLRDEWADGAEAYRGLSVPHFPNFFMLYGPNTNGVTSIIFVIEAQVHYIMSALRTMRRLGMAAVSVRPETAARHNQRIQAAMDGTVWTAGCTNYFQTSSGKVVTQMPCSGARYWWLTRMFPVWNYRLQRSAGGLPRFGKKGTTRRGVTAGDVTANGKGD